MPTFEIGIATLNRRDLLEPSLIKYTSDFPGIPIHVVDNGNQGFTESVSHDARIYSQPRNIGVAASWNLMCRDILHRSDYALIINDDVYLGYGTEQIDERLRIHGNPMFLRSTKSWSVFLISRDAYAKVGGFDEVFYPAYYEDSDYIRRMSLADVLQVVDETLDPEDARTNGTYERNPELVNASMEANRERYIRKWGGLPLLEKHDKPYGRNTTVMAEPENGDWVSRNRHGSKIIFNQLDGAVVMTPIQENHFTRMGVGGGRVDFVDFPGGPMVSVGDDLGQYNRDGKKRIVTRIVPYLGNVLDGPGAQYVVFETK